jgi:hypothetical protein
VRMRKRIGRRSRLAISTTNTAATSAKWRIHLIGGPQQQPEDLEWNGGGNDDDVDMKKKRGV